MRSAFQGSDYRDKATALARKAGAEKEYIENLYEAHRAWWASFRAKSYVELGDEDIERHYYLSNYVMGSCSREPEFPPPIFGTWITTDNPGWLGDCHLNYNHMAPYYGLYSSNHLEQADPCHAPARIIESTKTAILLTIRRPSFLQQGLRYVLPATITGKFSAMVFDWRRCAAGSPPPELSSG